MPLISVIVPVYNAGAYLEPCLASIATQTHPALQVLLVDNASADGSSEVCMQFCRKDPRFVYLPQQSNLGAAGARGVGVAHAEGDYISFVDGDDLIHPQMLETLLRAAEESAQPVSCCRFAPFAADGTPENGPVPDTWQTMGAPGHLQALLQDKRVDYSLCNKLYARSLLTPGQFDTEVRYNEDLLINWLALQSASGLAFADFVGYHYRQHPASSSHRPMQPAFITDQAKVARTILQQAQGTALEPIAQAFAYEKLLYLYSMILRQSNAADFEPLRRPLLKQIRSGLGAGLRCPALGSKMKIIALATSWGGPVYAWACRKLLTDRQS